MIDDIFTRGWDNFVARTTGPLSFRFVMQPAIAAFLAIRAGLRDAREGRPAFFWSVLTEAGRRRSLLKEGFKDTGKVFIIAMIFDALYQLIVQGGVYAMELLFTATLLAFVPYLLIRGPVNRIATWARRRGSVKRFSQEQRTT